MQIKTGPNSFYVYIVTDNERKILNTGTTGDLLARFTRLKNKYKTPNSNGDKSSCNELVYWESFDDPHKAIDRDQEISKWSKKKKELLINKFNPEWRSLNSEIGDKLRLLSK